MDILQDTGARERFALVRSSEADKLVGIPASYSPAATCPDSCPLKRSCYAKHGNVRFHWERLSRGEWGTSWTDFLRQVTRLPIGQLWRHNVSGDLPRKPGAQEDRIDRRRLQQLAAANRGRQGFTFSHYPVIPGHGGGR